MAMQFNSVRCPECGGSLQIEEGRKKFFCSHCGAQIMMMNENEHVYRHIDEARIKEVEATHAVELKKLELLERKRAAAEKTKKVKIIASVVLGIVGVLLMLAGMLLPIFEMGLMVGMMCFACIMWIWLIGGSKETEKDKDC